jgi:hypothetical protein
MKVNILLAVILLGGCTTVQEDKNKICVEYITYSTTKEECTGGRGVAPQICVIKPAEKLFCTRYESSTI